jgi:hypothetical protein
MRVPYSAPGRIRLMLPGRYQHGRAEVTLPELNGHALLVFA